MSMTTLAPAVEKAYRRFLWTAGISAALSIFLVSGNRGWVFERDGQWITVMLTMRTTWLVPIAIGIALWALRRRLDDGRLSGAAAVTVFRRAGIVVIGVVAIGVTVANLMFWTLPESMFASSYTLLSPFPVASISVELVGD